MVMLNKNVSLKWVDKYSKTSIVNLKPSTIQWYKWCQKVGRRRYLEISRAKTRRFEKKHPGNKTWRVFKCLYLKNQIIDSKIVKKVKNKIEKHDSMRGMNSYIKALKIGDLK